MASPKDDITLTIGGREVVVTHASKPLIPEAKVRKLDLVNYYVAVAEGALRGAGGRPCVLVRYPDGVGGEFFFQKRAPAKRPEWLEVASIRFPSGRRARARAACMCWCASSAAGASTRCGAPRWHWRARSSAARPRSPPAPGG